MSRRYRPITIHVGRQQTTLRIEPEYRYWLRQAAYEQNLTARDWLRKVARTKSPQQSLSSAIRIAVIRHFHDHPRGRCMKCERITVFGHVTSLALEKEHWQWLREIARATRTSQRQLIEHIAANKGHRSLASAVRCHVAVART
jgi:predicted DNA-binding ribbon-helix-helix protein